MFALRKGTHRAEYPQWPHPLTGHYGIPISNVRENLESVRFRAILRSAKLQPVLPGIPYRQRNDTRRRHHPRHGIRSTGWDRISGSRCIPPWPVSLPPSAGRTYVSFSPRTPWSPWYSLHCWACPAEHWYCRKWHWSAPSGNWSQLLRQRSVWMLLPEKNSYITQTEDVNMPVKNTHLCWEYGITKQKMPLSKLSKVRLMETSWY